MKSSFAMKPLAEFLPLIAFIVAYKGWGLMPATLTVMIATIIMTLVNYTLYRRIEALPTFSALLLMVFGGMSLWTGNMIFIKMKPTIINLLFAALLLGGVWFKRPFLKYVLSSAIAAPERVWLHFSFRWGLFFLVMAATNEYVWRHFSESQWVNFKAIGLPLLTIGFMLTQMPAMMKYTKPPAHTSPSNDI